MSTPINDGGPAIQCKWCDEPAQRRTGRIMLCAKHYRISSMRSAAKRHNKHVPTRVEIESLVSTPMLCGPCGREMTWLRERGASVQVTLQHDRSGKVRLLCLACNARHAVHEGDSYYTIPKDMKFCPDCSQTKPRADFAVDRSRPIGLKTYCRLCASARHKSWRFTILKQREEQP